MSITVMELDFCKFLRKKYNYKTSQIFLAEQNKNLETIAYIIAHAKAM